MYPLHLLKMRHKQGIIRALTNAGYTSIEELIDKKPEELVEIKGMGHIRVMRLLVACQEFYAASKQP